MADLPNAVEVGERTQYTPGPWTVTESSHKQEWTHWIESGGQSSRRLVAAIGNDTLREGSCEANARLIAAAPELLEACEKFLLAEQHNGDFLGAYCDAQSAFEKATGKNSLFPYRKADASALGVCRKLIQLMKESEIVFRLNSVEIEQLGKIETEAREAIAKAEGRVLVPDELARECGGKNPDSGLKEDCQHLTGYWINRRQRNFRCYECQSQFHIGDNLPADHPTAGIEVWRMG